MDRKIFKAVLSIVLLAALASGLASASQLSAIANGEYDPVADDGKTPAEAALQVIRLERILAGSGTAGLLAGFCLWRISRWPD
jgi:hypothetical protein